MSLERAGEFLLEFIADEQATQAADHAYLQAVADLAESRGYDLTTDELVEAFRSLVVLDDEAEVAGFGTANLTVTVNPAANTATHGNTVSFNPAANTASHGFGGGFGFQPLGSIFGR